MTIFALLSKVSVLDLAPDLAVSALDSLKEKKINQFVVVDDQDKVVGVISMHDLISAGV